MTPTAARLMTRTACASALCALLVASPAHALELLSNGSFEVPVTTYLAVPGASNTIPGWTTVLSGVELFNVAAYDPILGAAADGLNVVDLANFTYPSGGLEQTVTTVAGQAYTLTFAAGNSTYASRTGNGEVKVTVDGLTTLFNTAVAGSSTVVWATQTLSFVAATTSTTVRFWNDQDPFTHFAFVDQASLQASVVPEAPGWVLAFAGMAAATAGLKRRRV
jgi:hypothetical protein